MAESLNYRPSHSAVHYVPPKQLNAGRTLLGTTVGAILISVGAVLYVMSLNRLENAIYRVGAVGVAALATGLISMGVVRYGKVQGQLLGAFLGAGLGMLALYVMWLAWARNVLYHLGVPVDWHFLMLHPVGHFELIQEINELGVWAWKGRAVTGLALLLFWLAEGGAILACAVLFAVKNVGQGELVCRECGARCERVRNIPRFAAAAEDEFLAAVENRTFSALASHPRPAHEDDPELGLALLICPQCAQTNVLTVSRIAWQADASGSVSVQTVPLVDRLMITQDEAEQIKQLTESLQQLDSQSDSNPGDPENEDSAPA